jgi:hypothetical protein
MASVLIYQNAGKANRNGKFFFKTPRKVETFDLAFAKISNT